MLDSDTRKAAFENGFTQWQKADGEVRIKAPYVALMRDCVSRMLFSSEKSALTFASDRVGDAPAATSRTPG